MAADPVEAKSTFLTAYMSQHSDTLVAYILHELQRSKKSQQLAAKDVQEPKMLKISSRFMRLQYRDGQDGQTKTVCS